MLESQQRVETEVEVMGGSGIDERQINKPCCPRERFQIDISNEFEHGFFYSFQW